MLRNILAVILSIGLLAALYLWRSLSMGVEDDAGSGLSPSRQGLALVSAAGADQTALRSAQEFFRASLSVDPKDPVALFGLGWSAQLLNDSSEASRRYAEAEAELRELLSVTLFNQSFLKEQSGDLDGALELALVAQEVKPEFEAARVRASALASKVQLPREGARE